MDKIRLIILATAVALAGAFSAQAISTSDYVIDEGSPSGDLNGDDNVNVGDVSELYRAILNGSTASKYDLNGDGNVNVGDVSELYSMILNGTGGSGSGGSEITMYDLIDCKLTSYNSSDYLHKWVDGDVIYLAVDGNSNDLCQNVYAMVRTGGKWVLQDVQGSNKVGFKTSGGTVNAVYVANADVANSYYNYIPLSREVACMNNAGTYTVAIKDNKFYITLKGLYFYQFASRIDVNAANEGDYFYGNVKHLDALTKISWLPLYGYASFETSSRAPVVDIDPTTHKGAAYGVWEKGTRVSGYLTLNYAKSNGYCYFWNYGTENLTQGRYLTSVYSPWQNGWTRDLSMRFYNQDSKTTERLNAGASTETVFLNVGTDIMIRAYNGENTDTQGQILSATTSTSGVLDVSISQPGQVNVTAHKAGTTTLTIKHKTKDNITATYTYDVRVAPTLWIAGSAYDPNSKTFKPMLWRNHQSKAMYLSGRDNYTAATKVMVHGNNAAVMMRKDVISPKTFYRTTSEGTTYSYDRYFFTGTSATILKATSAHGGGYFNVYTSGITGAHHLINEYMPIYGVPRMWTDKSGNVYHTSAVRSTSSDVMGVNTGSVVNTTIYKNKSAILTVDNFAASDIAVSESSGKIYVVGYSSNAEKIVSSLIVINGTTPSYYVAESSAKYYYLAFTRLYLDQSTETAYIEYMAGNYGTINGNYHTCIYRYKASTGLQVYTDVNTGCTYNYPFMNNGKDYASYVIKDIIQFPFVLYGDKFYFLTTGMNSYLYGTLNYYQLGASSTGQYEAVNYNTDGPCLFEIKNGYIGTVMYDKSGNYYYPMCCELNSYKSGTRLEDDNQRIIYDVYLQTTLDD